MGDRIDTLFQEWQRLGAPVLLVVRGDLAAAVGKLREIP
jgi:hypothetical protein